MTQENSKIILHVTPSNKKGLKKEEEEGAYWIWLQKELSRFFKSWGKNIEGKVNIFCSSWEHRLRNKIAYFSRAVLQTRFLTWLMSLISYLQNGLIVHTSWDIMNIKQDNGYRFKIMINRSNMTKINKANTYSI